jgi:hypothetical protein
MKLFDYKFIMILALSLAIYFLYRQIEHLEQKVKLLENNKNNENFEEPIDLQLPLPADNNLPTNDIQLPLPADNNNLPTDDLQTDSDLQLPLPADNNNLPTNDIQLPLPADNNNLPTDDLQTDSDLQLPASTDIVIDLNKFINEDENIKETLDQIDEYINEDENMITVEEYSNQESDSCDTQNNESDEHGSQNEECYENNDMINIYSNDNEDDDHTSLMESMVEAIESNNNNDKVSELLRNKLPELQEIAHSLNISITRENSNKKKTKLELAKEISENQ